MKIGVLSDSHGEAEGLERAAKLLNEIGEDVLIHLGDDSADAKALEKHKIKVIKVPGVFEPAYEDPSIPNRLIEQFEGWKV
ncbi:MAG TPA: YfcE family phosphodiesterase, partial [Thermoplasmata archaeon]|nr:YfcE family phosphodiesterase [Thermoplasmata archaeon]